MKFLTIALFIFSLTGCDKIFEIKACEITNSDSQNDIGQCIKLNKSVFGKDDALAACKATVNSYLKNKYGSRRPDNVLFVTSSSSSCK